MIIVFLIFFQYYYNFIMFALTCEHLNGTCIQLNPRGWISSCWVNYYMKIVYQYNSLYVTDRVLTQLCQIIFLSLFWRIVVHRYLFSWIWLSIYSMIQITPYAVETQSYSILSVSLTTCTMLTFKVAWAWSWISYM